MTAATALRATALPMPAVVTGETVRKGRSTVQAITVGGRDLFLGSEGVYSECGRCSGRGWISAFGHVYDGVCFECNTVGVRPFAASIEAAQRKVRSAQAKALRAQAEAVAAEQARLAALPGIIAAAHVAALAEDDQREAAAREAAARTAAQRFIGTEGDKITFTGKVVVTFDMESVYGTRVLVVIEGTGTDAGATLKTVGTSAFHFAAERGEVVTVKATVKDHETYNGTKQTVVLRPKAV